MGTEPIVTSNVPNRGKETQLPFEETSLPTQVGVKEGREGVSY